ncbi:response regulator [uncultured Croceitalea sp.]|uniref:response regulator n=1 Tax=uncultured Croceitalea sp. TaxID=1798908 RepID=UPI00374E664B
MFKKVLVAEDHGLTGTGLKERLSLLQIPEVTVVHYCDDALLKSKGAVQQNQPFDLLITDLSFKNSYKGRRLTTGEALIAALREIQPSIKIIVYSVEHRVGKIKSLFDSYAINGFVGKDREDLNEINKAIQETFEGRQYISPSLQQSLRSAENQLELDTYDIEVLRLLSKGFKQEEIAKKFQEKNYPASSLRSIQDRLVKLKTIFEAKTPTHLVAQAMERGFI